MSVLGDDVERWMRWKIINSAYDVAFRHALIFTLDLKNNFKALFRLLHIYIYLIINIYLQDIYILLKIGLHKWKVK